MRLQHRAGAGRHLFAGALQVIALIIMRVVNPCQPDGFTVASQQHRGIHQHAQAHLLQQRHFFLLVMIAKVAGEHACIRAQPGQLLTPRFGQAGHAIVVHSRKVQQTIAGKSTRQVWQRNGANIDAHSARIPFAARGQAGPAQRPAHQDMQAGKIFNVNGAWH